MNTQPTAKFDLYQNVTDRIVEALETGTAPWLKPWDTPACNLDLPRNAVSNRLYSGINILLLWLASSTHGYRQSKWITAKKAMELGGHVRKGEKATVIVNYRPVEREATDENGELLFDDDGNPLMEHFAYLNKHNVFNIEQCENLPPAMYEPLKANIETDNPYEIFTEIRQMIKGLGLKVEVKPSNKAFYQATTDKVVMPEVKQFHSEQDFYSTLMHEMTHATGHQSRLNREGISSGKAKFGNKIYAFEELVAEIGGAFLCAQLGFNTVPQNASYIASWIQVLKNDKRAIFRATGYARNACDYMLEALNVQQQYESRFEEAA
ncbi:antirestriction protein [Haemophilus paracuniculus]|uniref:Antirestriction protein n=1 Tax=Haemophilus paracuniculus TaxID=734 RepID=A0A1T0AVD0_9PAST|nr:zincin-like metallopeptidase domain-containing protein [Haemophilus paracuniculus]OOS00900.1 antirestriction protein [Haemophilus paracuniculus]